MFRRFGSPLALAAIVMLVALGSAVRLRRVAVSPSSSFPAAVASPALKPIEVSARADQIAKQCPDIGHKRCFHAALGSLVPGYGPQAALDVLQLLQERGIIARQVDDHQLAHEIGRTTAAAFGVTGPAFLLCSTDYNYGCQHGFFEYALGRATSAVDAAMQICGVLREPAYAEKFIFSCYHGLGHGILMATAYDLLPALATCDALPAPDADDADGARGLLVGREGCWQGVFMENVNAALRGEARDGVFISDDPLAPCNRVAPQYQHECYINHAGWLMHVVGADIRRATAVCRAAGDHRRACLESIGLMVTNPTWQPALARTQTGHLEEDAWRLCREFPADVREVCVAGAIDNLMNFDELDLARAREFCGRVDTAYRRTCFVRIGLSLRRQVTALEVARARCAALEAPDSAACLEGIGS